MAEELIIELGEEVYSQCEETCRLQGVDIGQLLGGWVKWIALPRKKMEVHAFYHKKAQETKGDECSIHDL